MIFVVVVFFVAEHDIVAVLAAWLGFSFDSETQQEIPWLFVVVIVCIVA